MSTRAKFLWRLSELRLDGRPMSLCRLAEEALCATSHSHLSQVINGKPGRGRVTRRRVAQWLVRNFPAEAGALLAELGWDESGELVQASADRSAFGRSVPRGTFQKEQSPVVHS